MMTYFNIAVSLIVASFELGEAVRSAAAAGESFSSTVEQVSSVDEDDAEVEQEIQRLADDNLNSDIHGTDTCGDGIMYYVFDDISDNMKSKRVNVIKTLAKKYNVDVNNQQSGGDGSIPLHYVVDRENTASVEALIELGADPNVADQQGRTSLHIAHEPATIEALIKAGANVNVRDVDGDTPLITAVCFGRFSTIRPLMMNGADHTIRNKEGKTVLDEAGELTDPSEKSGFGKTLQPYIDAKAMAIALGRNWKDYTLIGRTPSGESRILDLQDELLRHISDFLCKKRE